jgi:glycosyltransferase involved in cell wall biosynthesis
MKKVVYLQYTNPAAYPPLEHSSQILAREGWDVLFLGVKSKATAELKFEQSSIQTRLMEDSDRGWRQKLHYLRFVLWTTWWTLRRRPQWIYASDVFSCPAALLCSFIHGVSVIYHEHDFHAPEQPSLFLRFCQSARKALARRAQICVVPNEVRGELFRREHPSANVICVWNCPTLDEISTPRTAVNEDEFWLLYHGSVVPVRLPISIIECLKRLPESVKLRVVGYEPPGNEGYIRKLEDKARELRVADRVDFCAPLPRNELLALGKDCGVGLAFVPCDTSEVNMKNMTGASNKPFDYLANGLALLVTDVPDWRRMFIDPGYAVGCDPQDVNNLVAAVSQLHRNRQETASMGERGRKRILSQWNYETQFAPVLGLMNNASVTSAIRLKQTTPGETVG